jgi:CBS domain containing-hemolysin-like protein
LVLLAALLLSAVFSTLFFAMRDFSLHKLEELARSNGGMAKLRPIVDRDDVHARALGVMRLVCNTVLLLTVALIFTPLIEGDSFSWRSIAWANVGSAVGVSAALLFVFSLLLPTSIAQHAGERAIHSSWWVIRATAVLCRPLVLLGFVDEAVKRLAGESETTGRDEIEDEIISAVSEGERGGHLHAAEREMIRNVVELSDTTVDEVMTPRTEVEGFAYTDDLDAIKAFIKQAGHSRIPVYEEDLDHIVGMLYAKDLIPWVGVPGDWFSLRSILRRATLVPERKAVGELLSEMQHEKVHLAIVVDEYGGTAGLVTLEDIVEEIVGEIQDEYEPEDDHEPDITLNYETRTAEGDARVNVADANQRLRDLRIELKESDDYDTLGGWVLSELGRIPAKGETFETATCRVEVVEAEQTRIHKVRFEALLDPLPDDEDGSRDMTQAELAAKGGRQSGGSRESSAAESAGGSGQSAQSGEGPADDRREAG